MHKTYALVRPLLVFGLLSLGGILLAGCPDGSHSSSAQNNSNTSGTDGTPRAECAPRSLTARLSTDGYATVTGTLPNETPEGTPVKYQYRVTHAGRTETSNFADITSVNINSNSIIEIPPTKNGLGESEPIKSGDIIEIRNDCGTDTATVH